MEDYRDKMTLEEIEENDRSMAEEAIKGSKKYTFNSFPEAIKFVGHCIGNTLVYLGIPHAQKMDERMLKRWEKHHKVRVERRPNQYSGADVWRNGFYIYKKGELVAFISEVLGKRQSPILLPSHMQTPEFHVITNARV